MKIPDDFFDNFYQRAIKIKEEIISLLKECDNDSDCDEKVEDLENQLGNLLSYSILVPVFDKETNRKDGFVYDVSKIKVSSSFSKKIKNYNKKILKLIYGDLFLESYLERKLALYDFIYGFSENNNQEEDIVILEDAIIKNNVFTLDY
jgi:hypothetical protein